MFKLCVLKVGGLKQPDFWKYGLILKLKLNLDFEHVLMMIKRSDLHGECLFVSYFGPMN